MKQYRQTRNIMRTSSYRWIIEPLLNYTYRTGGAVTSINENSARLIYEIIREAICDLHGTSELMQKDAENYFESELFTRHCELVCISKELMLYIVNSPQNYTIPGVSNENLDFGTYV